MYYRRKILLALLDAFNGELNKLKFQSLLFLFNEQIEEKIYSFIPYKDCCHSFHAEADLYTMQKYKQVKETDGVWYKTDKIYYLNEIDKQDKEIVISLAKKYFKTTAEKLIRQILIKQPYYGIKSKTANKILDDEELTNVKRSVPLSDEIALYTIGYEGLSPEEYLNKLIKNDIKVLCDVRRNPLSMKYGFSKKQLNGFCEALGISYIHFPNLGIASEKRKELKSQDDYEKLFIEYGKTLLKQNITDQEKIIDLVKSELRVAITCFEADVHHCHRFHLAMSLQNFKEWQYKIIHI